MSSMQQFSEKVIAITGAASGIGLATAMLLASRGATLSIADVQAEPLRAAERAIAAQSPGCALLATILDVRDAGAVEAWIEATVSRFGRLDGAANVAGVVPRSIGGDDSSLIEKYDMDEYDTVMGVNARGLMLCLKYQLAAVGKGASIVNAASIAGLIGRAKNASYAASKHAVVGLTRSAAKEVGPRGVRVNCICPYVNPFFLSFSYLNLPLILFLITFLCINQEILWYLLPPILSHCLHLFPRIFS